MDYNTLALVSALISVGSVVVRAVWKLASEITKLSVEVKTLNTRFTSLPCVQHPEIKCDYIERRKR